MAASNDFSGRRVAPRRDSRSVREMNLPRFKSGRWVRIIFRGAALAVALIGGLAVSFLDARAGDLLSGPVRIMAVGDSITEGADKFSCYRYPLWEKLSAAGYVVEFVGTRTAESRVGPLAHEGYGGKNTEFLAREVPAHFRAHPADIVLLHSGHNHFVEEKPVPGIVAATEQLIAAFRAVNPRVTVLLAQVIPAGKLPKYAYIPELNAALAQLAARLDQPERQQRVVLVDQASGFDCPTDTIDDKVHPNAQGAEKMAAAWFAALETILPVPVRRFAPEKIAYRQVGETKLELHVFGPGEVKTETAAQAAARARPAVLFFFGGGWRHGTPIQFYPECAQLAERGYVAISADYRISSVHGTTPFDALADAEASVRWVRAHAAELGVDPQRVYVAGASAGGHLAACLALSADASVRPDAALLWYPVLDVSPTGFSHALFAERFAEASPLHLAQAAAGRATPPPPMLVLLGTEDSATPMATAQAFQAVVQARGGRCELVEFPGGKHPLYAYRTGGEPGRAEVMRHVEKFLDSLPANAAER